MEESLSKDFRAVFSSVMRGVKSALRALGRWSSTISYKHQYGVIVCIGRIWLTKSDTCARRGDFDVFICGFGCGGVVSDAQGLHEAGGTRPENFGCQHLGGV